MTDHSSTATPSSTARVASRHPGVDTWIAYHAGTVSPSEHKRLQQHLTGCRDCLDLVLDLDRFAKPADNADREVSDFEQAAVWRSLQNQLETEPKAVDSTRPQRSTWVALAAAATFAILGLSQWSTQQQEITRLDARVAELSRPHANALILDLTPGSRQRSARGADVQTPVPASDAPVTLILNLAKLVEHDSYRLAILDASGVEVQRIDGMQPTQFGNFTLALPAHSLPAGAYELRLFGVSDDASETLLETYPISLS
ncbi:MAG: zf-HC2 domain-containing protein [Acidobacteriota bacterium]